MGVSGCRLAQKGTPKSAGSIDNPRSVGKLGNYVRWRSHRGIRRREGLLARNRPLGAPVETSVTTTRALHAVADHDATRVKGEGPPPVTHALKARAIRSGLAPVDHSLLRADH
jgi:hypothetical protein